MSGKRLKAAPGLHEAAAAFEMAAPDPTTAPAPLVAIGASAGGLEAIEQFFAAVELPCRFAFVIVQQLSPDLQSLMVELLAKQTSLAVRAIEDGMVPVSGAIHLIPPGKSVTLEAGRFRLADADPRTLVHHPIDEFFVSLATDRGTAAIGVVLSGSGSDGSRGARAIRAAGGRVLVQQPKTATFSSMPQAAIEAGCDGEVMAPDAMPLALLAAVPRPVITTEPAVASALPPALVACLDQAFGIDFSVYRHTTLPHRVNRRMMLRGFDRLDAYAAVVADDPDEQEALFQDLLIGTPGFFRDAAAMAALEREVLPALAARLDEGEEVRAWVPACATGEEAYALAISILAHLQELSGREALESVPLALFATDVHRRSLAIAGAGFYSEEAVAGVRPEWRRRFFDQRGSGWQIKPAVRRLLTFSPHDVLREPPFTRLQLISCRNLASLLAAEMRDRLMEGFASALLPGGHLLLGSGETAAEHEASFAPLDPVVPLYRKKRGAAAVDRGSMVATALPAAGPTLTVAPGRTPPRERRDLRLTMAHELLLDRYVPPSLLVDEAGQVIHCFGDAGAYLQPPRGRPSLAVLDMVKDPLRAPLASAINRVKRTGRPITLAGLALGRSADAPVLPRLVVEAPSGRPDSQRCLLVSFDDRQLVAEGEAGPPVEHLDEPTLARLDELERDLRFGEASLKATLDGVEAAHHELVARNQALEAAHAEALASLEALRATGLEQQRRIDVLLALGQELESLVEAVGLAALLLDPDLSIRRFTPAAMRFFNLLPQDLGRPLGHVTHQLGAVDIMDLLEAAAASRSPRQLSVETPHGSPVRLTVTPLLGLGETLTALALAIDERPDTAAAAVDRPFPDRPVPSS
jgi:two-component system CheB/CheR fusion protein